MNDRENDTMKQDEGRRVQQELEDQLRAFGDTMTDAFAHGFEGRGMDIGDRAWDVGKAAVHAANYGIGEAAKAFRQGRRGYPYGDAKQPFREGAADADPAGMPGWFRQIFAKPEPTPVESIRIDSSEIQLQPGERTSLSVTVKPIKAYNKGLPHRAGHDFAGCFG